MGERTLLKLTDGENSILLYLHWYNVTDCKKAVKETMKNKRNNITELAKFVIYFILDHEQNASIYVIPKEKNTYGEDQDITININEVKK